MKKQLFAFFALAAAVAISPAARADTFDFSFTGSGGVTGSGTLTGTYEGSGEWLLTSGSGNFNDGLGSSVLSLIANPAGPANASLSPSGYIAYDDLLNLWGGPAQYLTVDGLLFSYEGMELNLWQPGAGPGSDGWFEASLGGPGNSGDGTFSITAYDIPASESPEPGTIFLLGGGILGLAGALRQRRTA